MQNKIIAITLVSCILIMSNTAFGQTKEEATQLYQQGSEAYEQGRYEESISYLDRALKMLEELELPLEKAITLNAIGKACCSLAQFDKALSYYEKSLRISMQIQNNEGIATTINNIAGVYYESGLYSDALFYMDEAIKRYRDLNSPEDIALALNNKGAAHEELGEYDKALSCLEEALKIRREHNLIQMIPSTLNNIAAAYEDLGRYEKALAYFEEARKMCKELGMPQELATVLSNTAYLYQEIGQYEKALSLHNEALKIDEGLNLELAAAHDLNSIGLLYFNLGDYATAMPYLENSLKIRRAYNVPLEISVTLNSIGFVYLSQKEYKKAEVKFLEAESEREKSGTEWTKPALIELYIATKRYDKAASFLEKMRPEWNTSETDFIFFYTINGLILKGQSCLKKASLELLKAVSLSEEIRQRVREKSGFFSGGLTYGGNIRPYRSLVSTLADRVLKGETKDAAFNPYGKNLSSSAFYFSEAIKARTLLEAMAASAKKFENTELPVQMRKKEQDLVNQLSVIENIQDEVYKKGEKAFRALAERKETLRKEFKHFLTELCRDYPRYASLNYPQPILAEQLPLKENEVLLEYCITDDATYLFRARKGGVKEIIKIPKGKKEIETMVTEFCLPFEPDPEIQDIPYQGFSPSRGKTLYDLLLSEALKDLPSGTNIIIIPDGILGRLPFDALVINSGNNNLGQAIFVADKWDISYYQSATVLALNRMLRPSQAPKPIFALGNPIYNKDDPRYLAYKEKKPQPILLVKDVDKASFRALATRADWGKTTEDDEEGDEIAFSPLPETETEINSIAGLFNTRAQPPDILLGVFANETNLRKAKLNQYRLLHFATHADLPGNIQGINEPFLLLGQVENDPQDDGFLTLTEVLDIPLDADMVVLSACITARGKTMEGEGLLNFARAFQYAGAKTVLTSLWEVASEPTVEYMELLYRHLKEGKSKSQAFFLARKEMKQKYPNPFFWAVFVLHGER